MKSDDPIINKILQDEKLRASRSFQEMVYRDEPIIMTASQMKSYTPPKYREMKAMARSREAMMLSDVEIFIRQAKFMEDFEDDYDYDIPFMNYYPTYRSMNNEQLRTYFTWRTCFRKGEYKEVSTSYLYVYLYELLSGIGEPSKESCLLRMRELKEAYGEKEKSIKRHVDRWMLDFSIYHNLPSEPVRDLCNYDFDKALLCLRNCKEENEDTLFDAITDLSSYSIRNSKLFKAEPDWTKSCVCNAVRLMTDHCEKNNKKTYTERLYGVSGKIPYAIFDGAIFRGRADHEDGTYRVSEVQQYTCEHGRWYCERGYVKPRKSPELGDLIKTVDSMLRPHFGMHEMTLSDASKQNMRRIAEKAIDLSLRSAKKKVAPIEFDFSKLEAIRVSSEKTADKLMTQEERFSEESNLPNFDAAQEAKKVTGIEPVSPMQDEIGKPVAKSSLFDESEEAVLRLILDGEDPESFVRDRGKMLTIVVDGINDKLIDEIGDTVLEYDGDKVVLVEDYREEIKELIDR